MLKHVSRVAESLLARPEAPGILVLDRLRKEFGRVVAVDDLSLSVGDAEMVSLLGPSGCGKTTTLRIIAGLETPTSGEVWIGGRPMSHVPSHQRNLGLVPQQYALFPHMTVFDNIAFGLRMRRVPKTDVPKRVRRAMELVRLVGLEERMPRQLSGGQQQRVALARAIVIEPTVLLLDEPLGALDRKLRQEMQVELKQLQARVGLTTVFVTHDQEEALTLSDRVVIMHAGRIQQLGPPRELYERPTSHFVADFLGVSNFLPGRVVALEPATVVVETHVGRFIGAGREDLAVGQPVELSLRPEHVSLSLHPTESATNTVAGRVTSVVYHGTLSQYLVQLRDGSTLIAVVPNTGSPALRAGDLVDAAWSPDVAQIFPLSPDHAPGAPDGSPAGRQPASAAPSICTV